MTDVFPFSGLERLLTGMGVLRGSLTGDDYFFFSEMVFSSSSRRRSFPSLLSGR
jgi:hypothetical protein